MLPFRLDPKTAYTDTDSIITTTPEPLDHMRVDPVKLGAFKLEGSIEDFVALAKKTYGYISEGVEYVKAAGHPNNTITHAQLLEALTQAKTFSSTID